MSNRNYFLCRNFNLPMKGVRLIFLLVMIFHNGNESIAQRRVEYQNLVWARYSMKLMMNDYYQIRYDLEERTYCSPWRQHQVVSRLFVERKLGKGWKGGLGFTQLWQSLPQDPRKELRTNQLELRPQLELTYFQEFSEYLNLIHRYWCDIRFFEQSHNSFEFGNYRVRYKLEVRYSPAKKITLKVFDELHVNFGKKINLNLFDQNRLGLGIQYMVNSNYGFEMGYIKWYQQRKSGLDFYNRNVLRLTFHHVINRL